MIWPFQPLLRGPLPGAAALSILPIAVSGNAFHRRIWRAGLVPLFPSHHPVQIVVPHFVPCRQGNIPEPELIH